MPGNESPNWGQYLGMGLETALGVLIGYFAGHWLGNKFHWEPWGSLVGAMLGVVAGAYLLIKTTNRMNKD